MIEETRTDLITDPEELRPFFMDELEDCKFDVVKAEFVETDKCILYHSSINDKGFSRLVGVGAEANIVVIGGLPKTRKTTLINGILASAYITDPKYTFGYSLDLSEEDHILHIDTEQGKRWFYGNNKKLNNMCGLDCKSDLHNFHSYMLRQFNPHVRVQIIEHLLYSNPKIKFCVIDGIGDLMGYVNNADEATELVQTLMRWTHETNVLLLCVLHTNATSPDKLTGTLGSILQQKMDASFITSKDPYTNRTKVKNDKPRGAQVPSFSYTHDEEGMPKLVNDYTGSSIIVGNESERFNIYL